MGRLTAARIMVTGLVVLFWVGVFVAGALAEGYSARDDFISSLASRGSSVAALGIAALLALAGAHAVAGWILARAHRSRWGARLLVAAAAGTVAIAVFRVNCPTGAARCDSASSERDVAEVIHTFGVVSYEVFLLAAMVAVAGRAGRRQSGWPRWMAIASVAAAVASVLLILETGGTEVGLWQRLWIANNLGWLLVATWLPLSGTRPAGE